LHKIGAFSQFFAISSLFLSHLLKIKAYKFAIDSMTHLCYNTNTNICSHFVSTPPHPKKEERMTDYENEYDTEEAIDYASLSHCDVCCRCGRTSNLFYFPERCYCAACCDRLELDEVLHLVGAQSVSDLLCDCGFDAAR
jgi:hypothetical protein